MGMQAAATKVRSTECCAAVLTAPLDTSDATELANGFSAREDVETAWLRRTPGAIVKTYPDIALRGPGPFPPTTPTIQIDKTLSQVMVAEINGLVALGLLLQREQDGETEVLLLPEAQREVVKESRSTNRRVVKLQVIDEFGAERWLPKDDPATDQERARIAEALGLNEGPQMQAGRVINGETVLPCTKGHDPNYYVGDDGRRRCRLCRNESMAQHAAAVALAK